ncbi:MAG TPA: HEXXH motif-containing putative peptide modification protein, partial [Pseudonocardiaceae bacterium]|nr:HEXXH motif-containing putative peptide modification protein [Pseudonocardiaceae bacterium]
RVLGDPQVGEWVTRTALALRAGRPARPADLVLVAMAAAIRAGLSGTFAVPEARRLVLPTLGVVPEPATGQVDLATLEWRQTPRLILPGGPTLLLGDWPDVLKPAGLSLLGTEETDLARWRDRITEGWQLLREEYPDVAAELTALITRLAPVRAMPGQTNSATVANAFGAVFLSLPRDAEAAALTLAHELQHNKLAALTDLFALLRPGRPALFYVPWRADARPADGVLHGVYAHLGVAGFWRTRARTTAALRAHREFARWRAATLATADDLLASERLTQLGTLFVDGIRQTAQQWCEEPVPARAATEARRLVEEHRTRWVAG